MIYQIENFLSEENFEKLLKKIEYYNTNPEYPGWKFAGWSSRGTVDKTFWRIDLHHDIFFQEFLFGKVKKCIKDICGEQVELDIVYLNGATFGQQGYFHRDISEDDGRTFLIYANSIWNEEWGGATVFKNGEEVIASFPSPMKAVYFHGNIEHFSQSLSKDFLDLRVTVAYKLRKV